MIWHEASYLWLIGLIPLVALFIWWAVREKEARLRRYFDDRLVQQLRQGFWPAGERLRVGLILTACLFFIVGLAGPKIGTEVRDLERRGLDMMVILDLSRSMNAEDVRPSRLEKAKFEINRLLARAPNDRIGLIVFTGEAFVQSPMTQDHSAFRMFLDIAETDQMPSGTTNFGSAFRQASEMFERLEPRPDAARLVLLVSDGEDHGPSYRNALQELREQNVLLYTVGIGTRDGGRIPVYEPESGELIGYHRDRQGQEVITRLESETLQEIARRGNGRYYEIRNTSEGIDAFLSHMQELQRGEYAVEEFADYRNRYQIMVAIGLLFLVVALVLPDRWRRESSPAESP